MTNGALAALEKLGQKLPKQGCICPDDELKLLKEHPYAFMTKYCNCFCAADVPDFANIGLSKHHLSYVESLLQQGTTCIDIKNRRFTYMKEMERSSDYFSPMEMKKRNPWLYEQLVSRYMSADDIQHEFRQGVEQQTSFSDLLLQNFDMQRISAVREAARTLENELVDHSDSMDAGCDFNQRDLHVISNEVRQMYVLEFQKLMREQFLSGGDDEFDYAVVDLEDNAGFLRIRQQDLEDSYFDSEEPAFSSITLDDDNL